VEGGLEEVAEQGIHPSRLVCSTLNVSVRVELPLDRIGLLRWRESGGTEKFVFIRDNHWTKFEL
jgi:hypothetical protein